MTLHKCALAAVTTILVSLDAQAQGGLVLEEVVVTAQKRSQNLQDIPSSVNSFTGDMVEQAGWNDVSRMQEYIPSLTIGGESKNRPFVTIRGVGTRKFDIGADGSIGMFIDEVYNSRFSSALSNLMDIERIEVLKGPQGTLYGRNTLGGAINVITRRPENEFEAKVKVGLGNYDHQQVNGVVSGALIEDKLLGRVSAQYSDTDGMLKDTESGANNNYESKSLRASMIYNAGEFWELTLSADLADSESDAVLTQVEPGEIFGVVLASPADPRVPGIVAEGKLERYSNAYSHLGYVDRKTSQLAFKAKRSGDWAEFLAITAYNDEEYSEFRDMDGTTLYTWTHEVAQESKQFSQEFRLSSTAGGFGTFSDKLNWVTGIFYFHDDAQRSDNHEMSADSILLPPNAGVDIGYALWDMEVDTTSFALYGQGTYALTDALNVTLGLRYTDDTKDFVSSGFTNTSAPPIGADFSVSDEVSFDSLDPKLSVDYHFSDEVMAYATYSEGFKSGGIQFGVGTAEAALVPFEEEHLKSIELGIKSRLLDNRLQLNASVFQYDYKDQQLQAIINVDGAPVALTSNAGKSDIEGFEFEALALLTEKVTLDFKYAWLEATFDEFVSGGDDYSGNTMPSSPENAVSLGLNYSTALGDYGDLTFNAQYSWKDDQYFNFANSTIGLQEDYSLINLATWWDSAEGSTRVRLYCDNCADEEYALNFTTFPAPFGGGRRTWGFARRYGVDVTYNF